MNVTTVDPERLLRAARLLEPLAHPLRLRIVLFLLEEGEQTVGRIVAAMGRPQPEISRQLLRLADEGLLQRRRDGHHVHYRTCMPRLGDVLHCLDSWVDDVPIC